MSGKTIKIESAVQYITDSASFFSEEAVLLSERRETAAAGNADNRVSKGSAADKRKMGYFDKGCGEEALLPGRYQHFLPEALLWH